MTGRGGCVLLVAESSQEETPQFVHGTQVREIESCLFGRSDSEALVTLTRAICFSFFSPECYFVYGNDHLLETR